MGVLAISNYLTVSVTFINGFILLGVKILYLIDWADLYSILQG